MSKVCLLILLHRCSGYIRIDNLRPFIVGRARIHLSIERWRVCETWFAPSMAGVDSAGLGEVLQNVLASFSTDDRGLLVQVRYPTLPSSSLSLPSRCSLTLAIDAMPERVLNGYTSTDARSLGPPTRNIAADPPARNAAADSARRGPIVGRLARHGCVCADGGIFARGRDEG
jgi:hypothetical protein